MTAESDLKKIPTAWTQIAPNVFVREVPQEHRVVSPDFVKKVAARATTFSVRKLIQRTGKKPKNKV